MICPACSFANEDGALFCEKCKADLEMPAVVPPVVAAAAMSDQVATPAAEEPITLEPVVELAPAAAASETPAPSDAIDSTADHPAVAAEPTPAAETPAAAAEPPAATPIVNPKLVVVRGQRMDVQYPIYPGKNYLGRTDDKPVDIDLEDQESQDRIWTSRQHAVVTFEDGKLTVEDLNSLNGTFVNRNRVHPGQVKELQVNDVVQVGTVHMKVILG